MKKEDMIAIGNMRLQGKSAGVIAAALGLSVNIGTVSEETAAIRLQDNSTGVRIRLRVFFPNKSIVAIQ